MPLTLREARLASHTIAGFFPGCCAVQTTKEWSTAMPSSFVPVGNATTDWATVPFVCRSRTFVDSHSAKVGGRVEAVGVVPEPPVVVGTDGPPPELLPAFDEL